MSRKLISMHTDTFEKCAYFFKSPPLSRLDVQILKCGNEASYYNVFLSDTYLTDYLWDYYSTHRITCEKKQPGTDDSEPYIPHVFDYAIRSFGKSLDYDEYKKQPALLNPVERRLATMLVYCIQNPSGRFSEILLTQTFEYFRSLVLIKMGFFTQLLLSCCLIYSRITI